MLSTQSWVMCLLNHSEASSAHQHRQSSKLSTHSLLRTARHIVLAWTPFNVHCQLLSYPVKPHSASLTWGSLLLCRASLKTHGQHLHV